MFKDTIEILEFAYEEEALRLIRYWIPNIRIISPTHLQDKLEEGLREYLSKIFFPPFFSYLKKNDTTLQTT